ncbi:MAG TPA: ECF-type sigma factor [Candidatus Angelobacter sp.]|jgi:RNA polymerase sigma factor (TIGR02999 family)|nr:ECF-type sigma factor [Candidatus Angelobacter sp.]
MLDDAPITVLLSKIKEGDKEAEDRLMRLAYKILCRMARRYLAAEPRRHHTLQPSDVVNEYVIIARKSNVSYQSRVHFFAFAAKVMRHILVDHERNRKAKKRWDHLERISLEDVSLSAEDNASLTVIVRQLLEKLKKINPNACRALELIGFEGLSLEETAAELNMSSSTVKRYLSFARAWLHLQRGKGRERSGQS